MSYKKTFAVVSLFVFVGLPSSLFAAKSVYVINAHDERGIQVYRTDANNVTLQTTTMLPYDGSLIDLTAWPQKDLLFVTYEGPTIAWLSTKTLSDFNKLNINNPYFEFAGVVVDASKSKVYAAQRYSANLYVFSWDDSAKTLVEDVNNPHNLDPNSEGITLYDLALDETNGRLYVSDGTQTIHYYNTTTWTLVGSFDILVNANPPERNAVGIAIDPNRGYLYSGDWPEEPGNTHLVRTLLASPHSTIETDMGDSNMVIGIDVDSATGLVYCTTNGNDFRVYSTNLVQQDIKTDIGYSSSGGPGPAGVAVGNLYKSHNLILTKTDDVTTCVSPNNTIHYTLHYDANSFGDTNVKITDYLPKEVNFVSASTPYDYNSTARTVKWNLGTLASNASGNITLTAQVNPFARPAGTITNVCQIEGDNYFTEATDTVSVCNWDGKIIYVDRDANGFKNGIIPGEIPGNGIDDDNNGYVDDKFLV